MIDLFGYRDGQPVVWFTKNLSESNQYCPYCGVCVGLGSEVASNKEHLIARKFVPVGSLVADSFNFIFRSCRQCNQRKASAERHISSVTLFNSPARLMDEQVNALAQRKGSRDYHPNKKGVLVKDATDRRVVDFSSGRLRETFTLISPPQLNLEEVLLLACNHVQGLFAMLATRDPRVRERSRILPIWQIHHFGHYGHEDWGNSHLMEISRRVSEWPCYARISAASGYFKAILRRSDNDAQGWFWALEWNRFLRVVGTIGSPGIKPKLFSDLPDLGWSLLPDGTGRFRKEIPLLVEADALFSASVAGEENGQVN